ncbi:phosphoribosyltransferase family protein [Aquisalimonas lutea]|uniref:phosphoribosyltransferase n=1 Tax=Aquisalimonas lutea TaxID=1327750 RepID=UPI0025B2EE49|nr:phosphoribosyltransferase family protein [Aquisalimonas lutea]MDN3519410.1 phosphoribosyltransferase family protein [Aquisalimonas lutea]
MVDKFYISAQSLLEDSFRLGVQVLNSGFRPTFMIAVWRGGTPVGLAVQEFLDYHGVHTDHIAVRTSAYHGIDQQSRTVRVHGLNYLVKHVTHDDALLIVDDVFDTGRSVVAIIEELRQRARLNTPYDIRVAVPYYKPSRNEVGWPPDYYLHETEAWLKYPHSLEGLSVPEIRDNRPELYAILAPYLE